VVLVGVRHLLRAFPASLPHHAYVVAGDSYGVLGDKDPVTGKGTSHNQQVRRNDERNSGGVLNAIFVTAAWEQSLIKGLDYFSFGVGGHQCPSCGTNYRVAFFSWSHFVDGYNSNTFIYNMIFYNPQGSVTPPSAPWPTPGYHNAAGDWYPND
jgi:hypothetical protein